MLSIRPWWGKPALQTPACIILVTAHTSHLQKLRMNIKTAIHARAIAAGLVLSMTSLCPHAVIGEQSQPAASGFDQYRQQMQQEFQRSKDEFQEYRRQLLAAFETYRRKTAAVWGAKSNVMPDRTNWVSFQGDLNHRGVVDFEHGTVDVGVALPADDKVTDAGARRKLEDTIVKVLKQGADTRPMAEIAKQPVSKPGGPPVLKGQVQDLGLAQRRRPGR